MPFSIRGTADRARAGEVPGQRARGIDGADCVLLVGRKRALDGDFPVALGEHDRGERLLIGEGALDGWTSLVVAKHRR